jgi:hypothetical protein
VIKAALMSSRIMSGLSLAREAGEDRGRRGILID